MISIFYTADGKRAEHIVADKAAGCEWIDGMMAEHPDFCITGVAMHQMNMAFGDECARTLRLH